MEFQSQGDNGQLEWYKMIAGDPTPVKVRSFTDTANCIKVVLRQS